MSENEDESSNEQMSFLNNDNPNANGKKSLKI